jgi:hypothetical protein
MTSIPAARVPPLLCGHDESAIALSKHTARCKMCGSFWDLDSLRIGFSYDASYSEERAHFDPVVGALKARTLGDWLDETALSLEGLVVCEVGFGGGDCLVEMAQVARRVFGIEAVEENLAHVRQLQLPEGDLFLAGTLPEQLPAAVDLWLFQDSFEHIEEPDTFLTWLASNSSANARMLLVAPNATSPSARWMGRLSPHRLPDHRFHWSRRGVEAICERFGFRVSADFSPLKYVSPEIALAHLGLKIPIVRALTTWLRAQLPSGLALRFNIGEMGLLLYLEGADAAGPEEGA